MLDYGQQIHDGATVPQVTGRDSADIEALRNIFLIGQRAMWQLALSPHTYFEIACTRDHGRLSNCTCGFRSYGSTGGPPSSRMTISPASLKRKTCASVRSCQGTLPVCRTLETACCSATRSSIVAISSAHETGPPFLSIARNSRGAANPDRHAFGVVGADSPARPSLDVRLLPIDGPMILNVKHWKLIMWQCESALRHHRTQLIVDGTVLGLFLIFGACSPEYQAGDCIQKPKGRIYLAHHCYRVWKVHGARVGQRKVGPHRSHGFGASEGRGMLKLNAHSAPTFSRGAGEWRYRITIRVT